jgi:hypothetical protein
MIDDSAEKEQKWTPCFLSELGRVQTHFLELLVRAVDSAEGRPFASSRDLER